MNANDDNRAKRLDDYIDALNAGRPAPPETDDAVLAALFATARDFHRLGADEPVRDDVPSRLAAALERELRADQTRGTRRIESNDMSLLRDAPSNGAIRPPDDTRTTYPLPHRPERTRQWMQFLVAAVAFILVGVILAQIIGSGEDGDSDSATGVDPIATPTNELVVLDATATLTPSVQPTRSTETASTEPTPTSEPMATATEASTVPVLPTHQQVPTFDPLISSLVIAPDYATCGDTVMAYGSNFKPGTTITIYGGGLLGDVFAPVVDEHPVADDGSFAVQLDLSRVFDVCGGGSETPNGTQFRLGAETGSSLTKSDFNADDPRAIGVLTYSDDTPVGVADRVRLPSCGTEVILNGNMLRDQGQPDVTARECFAEAVAAGALAEFISHQQTVEGDVVTTIYNSLGNGDVDVIIDGSRDQFGSGEWQRSTCVWSEMSNLEPYSFHYEYCSEPVVIE